jgi:hypothetical protein
MLPDNLEMRFMSNCYEDFLILLFCCPKYSTFSYLEVHFADIVGAVTFYYDIFYRTKKCTALKYSTRAHRVQFNQ